jgi:hypothetical protein
LPYPLLAFGLVDLGGVPATALIGRFHLALYAFPAFALAILLSLRAVRRRARDEGLQVAIRPWAVTAVALCIAGATTSRAGNLLGIGVISAVGPFLAQATGFWLLGRWAGSDALLAASTSMVIASALIGSLTSGDLAVALQFGLYGAILSTAARYEKARGPTP